MSTSRHIKIAGAFVPLGGSGTPTGQPIEVFDASARKALTGLPLGAVVIETGRVATHTITVNEADVGGATTASPFCYLQVFAYSPDGLNGAWSPQFRAVGDGNPLNNIVYASGSTAAQIATAIAAFFAQFPAIFAPSVAGNVVTLRRAVTGDVGAGYYASGPRAGLVSVAFGPVGVRAGSTYRVVDPAQLATDAGWDLVDPSRNAHVPANAPIQPPQAWVDLAPLYFFAATGDDFPDLSNRGLTSVLGGGDSSTFSLVSLLRAYSSTTGAYPFLNLSGNALTNTDDILAGFAEFTLNYLVSGLNIDLSGGTNAAPTPARAAESVDVADHYRPTGSAPLDADPIALLPYNGVNGEVTFDPAIGFSASGTSGGAIIVGIMDLPGVEAVAGYIADRLANDTLYLPGVNYIAGSTVITVDAIPDADLQTLLSNGWSVTTN